MTENCIGENPWNIRVHVIKQEGTCAAGHKIGDEILISDEGVNGKLCISALYSMLPKAYAMMYNARFPWLKDQCIANHACPDGFNPVMFELTRESREP